MTGQLVSKQFSLGAALGLLAAIACSHNQAAEPGPAPASATTTYEDNTPSLAAADGGTPGLAMNQAEPATGPAMQDSTGVPSSEAAIQGTATSPSTPFDQHADVDQRDAKSPIALDAKDVTAQPPTDPTAADDQAQSDLAAAQASAVLERVHAFDKGAIEAGRLARRRGGANTASYATTMVREREAIEKKIVALAVSFDTRLTDKPADARARAIAAELRQSYAALKPLKGASFDRTFARQMQRDEQRELDLVTAQRASCSDTQICSILDELKPVLERSEEGARSLNEAVAQAGIP